ncbi:MAG TPA: PD-(D/E)XK nuclease family protein, partial [Mycobacteriales bacterium]|nr:PD-(D/E)XK nuclease family protein [Mycobacteriales bacterium]
TWWGLAPVTESEQPLVSPGEPVRLSGSSLSGLTECPLRWFLNHEAKAKDATSSAMGFGSVVHALAHEVASGHSVADVDILMGRLDRVWSSLAFDAAWQSTQQYDEARAAVVRFLDWHAAARDRTVAGAEVPFEVDVDVPGGTVRLRGSVDRLEVDSGGQVHVVDLKTGKSLPSGSALKRHVQLGTYQAAVRAGAFDDALAGHATAPAANGGPTLGGAELVMLRHDGEHGAKVCGQVGLTPADPWMETVLEGAARRVLDEQFPPTPDEQLCRRCPYRRCCPAQPEGRQVVP